MNRSADTWMELGVMMITSESITKIAEALLTAQAAIQSVAKDKIGKVQMKTGGSYEYKYSDLASVIENVKPHLNAAGIVFLQSPGGDSTGVMVTTRLLHTSGEWLQTTVYLPVTQGTPQAYGSAITYGKRYGLQSLVGLPSEDDDGAKASEEPKKPNTGKQVAVDAFDDLPEDEKKFLQNLAAEIDERFRADQELHHWLESKHLDTEEKLGLWSLLPSKIRSAIKQQRQVAQLKQVA